MPNRHADKPYVRSASLTKLELDGICDEIAMGVGPGLERVEGGSPCVSLRLASCHGPHFTPLC